MAGYQEYSKSNNAVEAENKGLKTASNIAKYLSKKYKKYYGCTAIDIKKVLCSKEWHHTSCWYNKTDYYDIVDLSFLGYRQELQKIIRERKDIKSIIYNNCTVEWLEWEGTRKRPKAIKKNGYNCVVEFNGKSTYKITLNNGVSFTKRKGTKGFYINILS